MNQPINGVNLAAVIYSCLHCGHFWATGGTDFCEKCRSVSIHVDWVEANDFQHPELEGFYDRDDDDMDSEDDFD